MLMDGSDGKESACNMGDPGSIPGLRRPPGEGNGNPLQYSCLENSADRRAWWATVHGIAKNQTQLINFHFHFLLAREQQVIMWPELSSLVRFYQTHRL